MIFRLGRLFYGGAHGVGCFLVKPRVLRSLHLSILVSVLEGGDISAGSDTVDLLYISILVSVLEGRDISAGSDTVDLLHLCNFDFLVFFFQE